MSGVKTILLLTLFLGGAWAQAPDNPDRVAARAIWEQMLAAKGGRERLMAVRSMELTGRDLFGEFDGETIDVFPDRSWKWLGSPSRPFSLSVCNVAAGISQFSRLNFWHSTNTDMQNSGCPRALQSDQLLWLNETAWLRPDPLRIVHEKALPESVDVVETRLDGTFYRADFYVDKRTHLPIEVVEYEMHPIQIAAHYRLPNYHQVDGIMVPSGISMGHPGRPPENEIRFTSANKSDIHFNVAYREETFTERPLVDLGPSAWKPGEPAPPPVTPAPTRTFSVDCKKASDVSQQYLEHHGWSQVKVSEPCRPTMDGAQPAECRAFSSWSILDAQGKHIADDRLVHAYTYNNRPRPFTFAVLGVWLPHGRIERRAVLSSTPTAEGCRISLENSYGAFGYEVFLIIPVDEGPVGWDTNRRLENEYLDAIEKLVP